ncbi:hypothetical protein BDV97DRAFT_287714 [Delphinella strobiligena]|nr:hypothetical protein BDV97DRAFT_287714 [Delphinella strobiligena]
MAFRQPQQRPQAQRQASFSQPTAVLESVHQIAARNRHLDESQEWILFSPATDDQQSTYSQTSQAPRTEPLSRLSDLESLETGVPSDQYADDANDGTPTCQGTELEDDEGEEDLDSLDDGLHAFHEPITPRLDHSGATVLPMHDGLGTFPSSYAHGATDGMQEHLWQFERYNPNRRRPQRRRSSVQKRMDGFEYAEEMRGLNKSEERRLRIEKWRLEQSRAVLEEIELETRRRTRGMSIISGQSSVLSAAHSTLHQSDTLIRDASRQAPTAIPQASSDPAENHVETDETETFWERITRRVIKDLMGLDETTLSVIFGEELPPDNTPIQSSPLADSTTPSAMASTSDMTWEQRLLQRIARELGLLAHRLAEHEGAFSAYNNAESSILPQQTSPPVQSAMTETTSPVDEAPANDALFVPTFPSTTSVPAADTSLWGIEEEPTPVNASNRPSEDKEYWERDLDVGVIFRYLRNRFSSAVPSPPPQKLPLNASALGTSPESFRRADMIRRHHPLVSHAATVSATRRRESMLLRRQHQMLMHRRAASSSCASQSTKRTRSGGSRRYWDFPTGAGGSAAGGSVVSVTSGGYEGMMGSWGEV